MRAEMYIWAFLSANKNTNAFEKNEKIQIRVKIFPKNVFENTKTRLCEVLFLLLFFIVMFNLQFNNNKTKSKQLVHFV